MKALGKAGGTHQFRVEFLGGPPPIHGHQGLRGRGDTVAVQVKLALPLGIRAPVFLGAGGHEAAGPGIHLQMQTGTGHCRQEGFGQRPFGSSTDSKGYVGVPKMFLALQRTEEWQQASILVEIKDRCMGHRLQNFYPPRRFSLNFSSIFAINWLAICLSDWGVCKACWVESAAYGTASLPSSLVSGASKVLTEAGGRGTGTGMLHVSSSSLQHVLAASNLLCDLS